MLENPTERGNASMANVYSSGDELLQDYEKLSQRYKNKAGRYIKNLLKVYRAENGIRADLYKYEGTGTGRIRCNFCGKTEDKTSLLILGNNVFICDECVRLCNSIVDEKLADKENAPN